MSVPRPAMLVATVTAPLRPACATMRDSRSCCLAFSTSCGIPAFFKISAIAFRLLNGDRADQHRLAAFVKCLMPLAKESSSCMMPFTTASNFSFSVR